MMVGDYKVFTREICVVKKLTEKWLNEQMHLILDELFRRYPITGNMRAKHFQMTFYHISKGRDEDSGTVVIETVLPAFFRETLLHDDIQKILESRSHEKCKFYVEEILPPIEWF